MASTQPSERLFGPAFIAVFASSLVFFTAGGAVLPVAPRFALVPIGADALGFGIAIGIWSFASLAARPFVGWSADRYGRRHVFSGMLVGLALMALLTLLPLGTLQLFAAIDHGYWYARSEVFMQQPLVAALVWMRMPGDVVFAAGALAFALFVVRLWLKPKSLSEPRAALRDA